MGGLKAGAIAAGDLDSHSSLDRTPSSEVDGNGGSNFLTYGDEDRWIEGYPAIVWVSGGDSTGSKGLGGLGYGSSATYGQDGENGWVGDVDIH